MFYMQYKGHEKAAKVVEFVAKWLNLCLSTVSVIGMEGGRSIRGIEKEVKETQKHVTQPYSCRLPTAERLSLPTCRKHMAAA